MYVTQHSCNSSISLVSSRSLTQQESIYNFLWKFFCENEAVNTRTTPRFTALNTLGGHFQRDTPHTNNSLFFLYHHSADRNYTSMLLPLPLFRPGVSATSNILYTLHIYRVSISLKKLFPTAYPYGNKYVYMKK